MARAAKMTTDHEAIREWAEKHGGHPAAVKRTGKGKDPGILRIDFPGFSGQKSLEPIEWDKFFEAFEANNLALLYREDDRFNKLIARETASARSRGERTSRRAESAGMSPQQRAAKTRARVSERQRAMEEKPEQSTPERSRAAKSAGRAATAAPRKAGPKKTTARRATTAKAKPAAKRPERSRASSTRQGTTKPTARASSPRRSTATRSGTSTRRAAGTRTKKAGASRAAR